MDKHYKNEPWALEMDEILKAIGDRGKGITDATTFYDFRFEDQEWRDLREMFRDIYQLEVHIEDYLWAAAEKAHDRVESKRRMGIEE